MPDTGWRSARGTTWLLAFVVSLGACAAAGSDGWRATDEEHHVVILRTFVDRHHLAFTGELRTLGWQPGRNVSFVPRRNDDVQQDTDEARRLLRSAAAETSPDLVVAFSTPFAELAAEELPDTPTLFVVNDAIASGLVRDLDQPEGMLTGVTFRTPADRTLELASRSIGGIERLGYLRPVHDDAVVGHRAAVVDEAERRGIEVVEEAYDGPEGVEAAVEQLVAAEVDAVWLANDNAVIHALDELEEHLVAHRLPTIANTEHPTFAVVVLTPDGEELRRQLARQASRLLGGAPVASVPVEDPRRFVVVINRTMLEELGLPPADAALLRQADVVR